MTLRLLQSSVFRIPGPSLADLSESTWRHHKSPAVLGSCGHVRREQKTRCRCTDTLTCTGVRTCLSFSNLLKCIFSSGVGAVEPEIGNTRTVRSSALKVAVPTLFAN